MPARAPKVPGGREGSKTGCRDRGKDAPAARTALTVARLAQHERVVRV